MSAAHNRDNTEQATVSAEEQARRREAMRNALVQVRLEGMEPDPIFFEYAERYARGELTLEEAVADYIARITHGSRAMRTG
jgi:hypothetical protein